MKQQKKKAQKKAKNSQETFLEHLQELRHRFFVWFIIFILGSILGYFLYPKILRILVIPLKKPLYYTSPIGGFETILNLSLFSGFFVSFPVLIYQVIKFVEPGFGERPSRSILTWVLWSFLLVLVGTSVSYFLILPATFHFLSNFGGEDLTALISTKDYFSFITKYIFGFALLFQLPLVMILVNKYKKLNTKGLLSNFKYVFLLSFIVSAILTPTPDPVNQSLMAFPIILLYLVSIGAIAIANNLY